jgi:SpoVK/Ycf46/Vps4 family AAA+-type ATPase
LRPERLGVHLKVPLPNQIERKQILETILKKKPISAEITADLLIERFGLINYSGADINSFVETATREAAWG